MVAQDPDLLSLLNATYFELDERAGVTPFGGVLHRLSFCAGLGAAALSAACEDGLAPTAGPPARLSMVAGDSQSGTVGQPLERRVRIRVVDAAGAPVWLTTVRFLPQGLSGSVAPLATETDANGEADAEWRLGTLTGPQRLQVITLDGPPEASYEFNALGLAGPATDIKSVVGVHQNGHPNETLPTPLVARVSDLFGNGVPGVPVQYTILRGTGQLSAPESVSDSVGLTGVYWTLGSELTGIPDTVIAVVEGLSGSPVVFTAYVVPP